MAYELCDPARLDFTVEQGEVLRSSWGGGLWPRARSSTIWSASGAGARKTSSTTARAFWGASSEAQEGLRRPLRRVIPARGALELDDAGENVGCRCRRSQPSPRARSRDRIAQACAGGLAGYGSSIPRDQRGCSSVPVSHGPWHSTPISCSSNEPSPARSDQLAPARRSHPGLRDSLGATMVVVTHSSPASRHRRQRRVSRRRDRTMIA